MPWPITGVDCATNVWRSGDVFLVVKLGGDSGFGCVVAFGIDEVVVSLVKISASVVGNVCSQSL